MRTCGLAEFAPSVWVASSAIRFAGAWFPHVMTVVRLSEGGLLLHSPSRPSVELFGAIDALGPVAHVVAPNWFHDLYLAEYRQMYPKATFWGPRFLRFQKGARLIDRVIDNATPWFDEMPHVTIHGWMSFDESLFFHKASGTLIVADLLMNVASDAETPAYTRFAYRFFGVEGKLTVFPLLRLDPTSRVALRRATPALLAMGVERVIVGHGAPINDAGEPLRNALAEFG